VAATPTAQSWDQSTPTHDHDYALRQTTDRYGGSFYFERDYQHAFFELNVLVTT